MRPLSPAERAAVLAEHPGTTEADLDRLEELGARRVYGAGLDDEELRRLDEEIAKIQRKFPRLEEAVARTDPEGTV
jgi:hypothetical protein